jgi:hypothetical protein
MIAAAFLLAVAGAARADVVTDWNQNMQQALFTAKTSPLVSTRVVAIVHGAIFDAVNGIERRYTPVHVDFDAPGGASRRAAAIQAAYATLVKLFPSQQSTLDAERAASLAGIVDDPSDVEDSQSIARGIAWGQTVADDILAWRATDGFTPAPPPFLGGLAPGEWRPTPPAFLPGAGPQFATMTPWAIAAPSQFRPAGPPALSSAQYAADFNEVKALGSLTGSTRTPFQTEVARFWAGNTALYWNRIALTMAAQRHTTLSENARLFALLNLAIADATIACWDAKYTYVFWRPITAIRLADTSVNPATVPDPAWTPLLITPNFPEYPSGHATISPAAATVLQSFFGDSGPFTLDSELLPGVLHSFTSFAGAADEAFVARIYGGIHFRTACHDGHEVGVAVGNYVVANALQPLNGRKLGQTPHNHPGGPASVEDQDPGDDGF